MQRREGLLSIQQRDAREMSEAVPKTTWSAPLLVAQEHEVLVGERGWCEGPWVCASANLYGLCHVP